VGIMSRMSQVMQIGNIEGDIHYYIEDYAYTYLKKQKGTEKVKYFLYGEKEEDNNKKKLYIYGIAEKPKMEQTYFKEYYPLGFLKIKNDETYWITLKGQEQKISGFYVFYAPNQAMQEYLVDTRAEEQPKEVEKKAKRQFVGESLPMKETFVPARKVKVSKVKEEKNPNFLFPIGGIVVACLILMVLTSTNGKKKVEIFKQVISQNISGLTERVKEEEFIIEEKSINDQAVTEDLALGQENTATQDLVIQEENADSERKEVTEAEKQITEEIMETITNSNKDTVQKSGSETTTKDKNYEEYIVKNGDTLITICKIKYGSLSKMEEICTINNIKNADYIAPGQKLYLP